MSAILSIRAIEIEVGFRARKIERNLDLDQSEDFTQGLMLGQMKASLTTKTAQYFAKFAKPTASSSRQVGRHERTEK
jgi:hypothetical protein